MSDRTSCVRCNRNIDPYAKVCPFCSWDQAETPPSPLEASVSTGPVYVPPRENIRERRILTTVASAALLLIVLLVVATVLRLERHQVAVATTSSGAPVALREAATPPPSSPGVQLVPAGDEGSSGGEPPLTSVPVTSNDGSMANPYARDDATALSQTNYAQLAQRARSSQPAGQPLLVDPRSVTTGRFSGQPSRHTAPPTQIAPPTDSQVSRTEPVAVYQPVPSIHVGGDTTARLLLTVGADGRVTDIDIARAIPGDTARLISAVQEWRFRPATENGRPVASRFSVDITFHGNE